MNFIFTLFTFKILSSYKILKKIFKYLSIPNQYVSVSFNQIGVGKFSHPPKGTFKTLSIPVLLIFILIIFYPDYLYKFMCLPKYFFKWGTNIWTVLSSWYFWIADAIISFILFLFGGIFYGLIWGYIIFAPIKYFLLIFDYLSKIGKKGFEFLVFLLFVVSWFISFLLTF